MKFNSVRTGNYAQSAKAVTQASDQIFNAAMSGKPDFTSISKEAIKGRSLERRAVTKAEGDVATAGIKACNQANQYKIKAETDKAVSDIKRPAKRMAGVVAGLGAISGAAVEMKASREAKAERAELRGMRESMDQKADELAAASDLRYQQFIDRFTNKTLIILETPLLVIPVLPLLVHPLLRLVHLLRSLLLPKKDFELMSITT